MSVILMNQAMVDGFKMPSTTTYAEGPHDEVRDGQNERYVKS